MFYNDVLTEIYDTTIKKVQLEVMATLMPTANKALQQVIDLAKTILIDHGTYIRAFESIKNSSIHMDTHG